MPLSKDEQRQLDALERQLHIDEAFTLFAGGLVHRLRLRLAAICITALGAGALLALSVAARSWGLCGPGLALLLVTAYQVWAVGRSDHRRPAHHALRVVSHLRRRVSPVPALHALRHGSARVGHHVRHPRGG